MPRAKLPSHVPAIMLCWERLCCRESCTSLSISSQRPPRVPNCAGSTHRAVPGTQSRLWSGSVIITTPALHTELPPATVWLLRSPSSVPGVGVSPWAGVWTRFQPDKSMDYQYSLDSLAIWMLPTGSFFSLMNVMILAMVVAAPNHSFNNFHYPAQLLSGSWPFPSELCVFMFQDLWVATCTSMSHCVCSSSWSSLHTANAFWMGLWQSDSGSAAQNDLPTDTE